MATDILPDSELKKFREGTNVERHVVYRRTSGGAVVREPIGEPILRYAKGLRERTTFEFKQQLVIIKGYQDDGISWACQQASEALKRDEQNSTWKVSPLVGLVEHDSLPEIVKDIGIKSTKRICRRLGLLPSRSSFLKSGPILFILAAIALSLAGTLLNRFLRSPSPEQDPMALHTSEWVVLVLNSFLVVAVGYLVNQVKIQSEPEIHNILLTLFGNADNKKLLHEITKAYVSLSMPRCVVIDDFARLDSYTREAVKLALTETDIVGSGSLLWVVFETREVPLLGRQVFDDPRFVEVKPLICELELVPEAERQTLAKALGWSEARAVDYLFLKTLAHGITDDEKKAWELLWGEFLRIDPVGHAEAAEIFQIIACNSLYHEFALNSNDLVNIFSTESDKLFLNLVRDGRRSLKRAEIREALTMIRAGLGPLLVQADDAQEKLRVKREAFDIVKPPEERKQTRMHLFWLLYWSRRNVNRLPNVRTERMLLAHISEVKALSQFLNNSDGSDISSDGSDIVEEYLRVLNRVAADCLDMTLISEAVRTTHKLLTALEVLTEDPAADDLRLSRVWRDALIGCWRVYVVTRAENILKPLFILLADFAEKKGTEPLYDPAIDGALLYLGLLGISEEKARLALSSKKIMNKSDQEIFDKVLTYLKATWVELLYLLTDAFGADLLQECNITPYQPAAIELLESIKWEDYEETKIRTQQEFRILNHELVNLLNYASARSGRGESPLDLYINVLAFEASSETQPAAAAQPKVEIEPLLEKALQREALASCLDSSLEVINLRQNRSHRHAYSDYSPASNKGYFFRSDIIPGDSATELNDICQEVFVKTLRERLSFKVADRSPLHAALFEKIEGLYQRAALIWEYFGFEDLRDRALIHRVDFVLRFSDATPDDSTSFDKLLSSMSNAMPVMTPTGLAANLQLAAFFGPVRDLSTKHFFEVACRIWEQEPSLSLMAASADAAINHVLRPQGPNVHRFASLLIEKLGDQHTLEYFAKIAEGRVLFNILSFVIQVPSILEDNPLFEKARALADKILRENWLMDERVRSAVLCILAVQEVSYQIRCESITDVSEAIEEWSEKFPESGLLSEVFWDLLRSQKYRSQSLRIRALDHLTTRPKPLQTTYDIKLCVMLVEQFASDSKRHLPGTVALLKDSVVNTVETLTLEDMVRIYALLMEHDPPEVANHSEAYTRFRSLYERRFNIENFVEFIRNGHYFFLLQHHYLMLKPFFHDSDEALNGHTSLQDMELPAAIARFRAHKDQVLKIVYDSNGEATISKTFFAFGSKFFNDAEAYNRDLREIQEMFNHASHAQLKAFFDVILHQADIPESLKEILQQRRQILLEVES